MAYKNLVNVAGSTKAEMFCNIRDWICSQNGTYHDYSALGLGWTLHDSYYATSETTPDVNDWVIFKSTGENGTADIYIQLKFASSTAFYLICYLYWNASTNTFVEPSFGVTVTVGTDTHDLWIYGSLDYFAVLCLFTSATYPQGAIIGQLSDYHFDDTVATSASATSAGTNTVFTVDAVPPSWTIGRSLVIRDNACIERAEIANISGLTVTISETQHDYAIGAKLAEDYMLFSYTGNSGSLMVNHQGDIDVSFAPYSPSATYTADMLYNDYVASELIMWDSDEYYGKVSNVLTSTAALGSESSGALFSEGADSWRYFKRLYGISTINWLFKEV